MAIASITSPTINENTIATNKSQMIGSLNSDKNIFNGPSFFFLGSSFKPYFSILFFHSSYSCHLYPYSAHPWYSSLYDDAFTCRINRCFDQLSRYLLSSRTCTFLCSDYSLLLQQGEAASRKAVLADWRSCNFIKSKFNLFAIYLCIFHFKFFLRRTCCRIFVNYTENSDLSLPSVAINRNWSKK